MRLQETTLWYNHEGTLHIVKLAGFCSSSQGKYVEAVKYVQSARDGYTAIKGPASEQTLQCTKHLEKFLQKAGLTQVDTNDGQPKKDGLKEASSKKMLRVPMNLDDDL